MQISVDELHAGPEFDRLLHIELFNGTQEDVAPEYSTTDFGKVLRRISQRVTPLGEYVALVSVGQRWRAYVGDGPVVNETADGSTPGVAVGRLAVKVFLQ